MPLTYAFAAVVRREASISNTSPTLTSALRARSRTSARSGPRIWVKRLNSGSMTIGVAYVLITPKTTTSAAAGIHQRRPKRRIANTRTAPPMPASTAPIAVLLTTSPA